METIIEFKKYADPKRNKNQTQYNSAIVHYKDANIEWFATFDEDDRELTFMCSNGFNRTTSYDEHGNKLVVQCIQESGEKLDYAWKYTWDYSENPNGVLVECKKFAL